MPAVVFLALDEIEDEVLPSDELGALGDLAPLAGSTLPVVVDAWAGRGRAFTAATGLAAADAVVGGSLLTRDVTIQAILNWDFDAQAGSLGTICARGRGGSASEYVAYALELRVVNAALRIGEVRWWWQDLVGNVETATGGQFVAPTSGFFLLTATRRWVSSTSVEMAYYVGDRKIGDAASTVGQIGGGVSGTFTLGLATVLGSDTNRLIGVIDQLMIFDEELSPEQIEATWKRLILYQPRGYAAINELMPDGWPLSDDPGSRWQRLQRVVGHALGFATAQAENQRANALPNRAYGPVLEDWEKTTGQTLRPGLGRPQRQRRVLAKLRQRAQGTEGGAGVSVPAITTLLSELLDCGAAQLEVLGFSPTVRDNFPYTGGADIRPQRWQTRGAGWTVPVGGGLRFSDSAITIPYDGTTHNWRTTITSMQNKGRACHILAKMLITDLSGSGEAGLVFLDKVTNHTLLLGLQKNGSNWRIVVESFIGGVSQGLDVVHSFGASMPNTLWLWLSQQDPGGGGPNFETLEEEASYQLAWSTTSETSGYSIDSGLLHPAKFTWSGVYMRSTTASNFFIRFETIVTRNPFSERGNTFYIYRDPNLPGEPDIVAAHHLIQSVKQAHTRGTVITTKDLRCNENGSGCNQGPMGALP